MSDFNRQHLLSALRQFDEQVRHAIHRTIEQTPDQVRHGYDPGIAWNGINLSHHRLHRVREALCESERLALRNLRLKLGQLDIAMVWPVVFEMLQDVALYLGAGALTGAALGAGAGFLAGGMGAIPGAAIGWSVGVEFGGCLLGIVGLKAVADYMLSALPDALDAYMLGFRLAWGPMPRTGIDGELCLPFPSEYGRCVDPSLIAHHFARGHEIVVMALLMGVVAYLTRGKGTMKALLLEVRANARLGPRFADWLAANENRLLRHPLLQTRQREAGIKAGAAQTAVRPGSGVKTDAARKALLDAKDWVKFPPNDEQFWQDDVLRQALNQSRAASGVPIEWHFSTEQELNAVKKIVSSHRELANIKLMLSPKN